LRRRVLGFAAQLAEILDVDFDHEFFRWWWESGTPR
jgi:hypothetical protein